MNGMRIGLIGALNGLWGLKFLFKKVRDILSMDLDLTLHRLLCKRD